MIHMEELKSLLCDELDTIANKGELTAGSLDTIDKLTHSIKSLLAIMSMEGESYDNGYGGYYGGMRNSRSYARGRRRGYSRGGDIEDRLMEIMDDVTDPKVKQALRKAIEKMEE